MKKTVIWSLGIIAFVAILLLIISSSFISQRFLPDSSTLASIAFFAYLIFSVVLIVFKEINYFKKGQRNKAFGGLITSVSLLIFSLYIITLPWGFLIIFPSTILLIPVFFLGVLIGSFFK